MMTAEDYMREALAEAAIAKELDEVPVGAVIVRKGEIIARAHNLREHIHQANAHAEMLAVQKASALLGTWSLDDCELYVTLEPCMMCIGVMNLARIGKLVYGTEDPKGGAVDSLIQIKTIRHLNAWPKEIQSGVLKEECSSILTEFFREKRKRPKRDRSQFNVNQ